MIEHPALRRRSLPGCRHVLFPRCGSSVRSRLGIALYCRDETPTVPRLASVVAHGPPGDDDASAASGCARSASLTSLVGRDDGLALRIMSGDDAAYFECHRFPFGRAIDVIARAGAMVDDAAAPRRSGSHQDSLLEGAGFELVVPPACGTFESA